MTTTELDAVMQAAERLRRAKAEPPVTEAEAMLAQRYWKIEQLASSC